MNDKRRKKISKIEDQLEELKQSLDSILEDEKEYYDNMPESFQDGQKGDTAQISIDSLETAISNIEDAITDLQYAR
jgi:flagellar biosynthesis chaperone FliJ